MSARRFRAITAKTSQSGRGKCDTIREVGYVTRRGYKINQRYRGSLGNSYHPLVKVRWSTDTVFQMEESTHAVKGCVKQEFVSRLVQPQAM